MATPFGLIISHLSRRMAETMAFIVNHSSSTPRISVFQAYSISLSVQRSSAGQFTEDPEDCNPSSCWITQDPTTPVNGNLAFQFLTRSRNQISGIILHGSLFQESILLWSCFIEPWIFLYSFCSYILTLKKVLDWILFQAEDGVLERGSWILCSLSLRFLLGSSWFLWLASGFWVGFVLGKFWATLSFSCFFPLVQVCEYRSTFRHRSLWLFFPSSPRNRLNR